MAYAWVPNFPAAAASSAAWQSASVNQTSWAIAELKLVDRTLAGLAGKQDIGGNEVLEAIQF